jgi:hypothetical protein
MRVRLEGEGKLWWVPSKRGLFGVNSFYSVMGCNDGFRFPLKNVWQTKVPLRLAFFVWSAVLRKDHYHRQSLEAVPPLWLIGVLCVKGMGSP